MLLTRDGIREIIKDYCKENSQKKLVIDSGSHASSVSKAINDHMPVCRKIAEFFGYERVVMYKRISK